MSSKNLYNKNLLFLATAKFELVADIIAHIKFLNQQSKIYVLAPEKVSKNFKKLKNVDVVLTAGQGEKFFSRGVSSKVIQRLKSIKFEHIYLCSKFNAGEILYYKKALQCSANLQTNNISLINYNLRSFPFKRKLFEDKPTCEICNSKMSFYRYTTFPSVSKPVPLYKCDRCNFISQDFSTLNRECLKEEYTNLDIPWFNFHGEMVSKSNRENLSVMVKHIPESSTILDMGCGTAGLGYYAKRDGEKVNVISFDLNKRYIEWARKIGINTYSVDITSKREIIDKLRSLRCNGIDCIHSNNTLEHLFRPYEVLRMWADLLQKGRYMHVTIPAADIVFDNYRGFEKYHLSYFTKETFTKLIKKAGLRVINSRIYKEDNHAGTGYMKFLIRKH